MLIKILNISKYSIFNWFSFIFLSEKISYIFNCSVIYFFFKAKKISYNFNYFFLYQDLNFPLLYVVKNINQKKKKIK